MLSREEGMKSDPIDGAAAYEQARTRGLRSLEAGRLEEAQGHFGTALTLAQASGDPLLIDRATCNEAAVAISRGEVERPLPALRSILMRNLCEENCALAAYNIARAYELRKEPKKSLFYARMARDRAVGLEHPQRLAAASNQIGNALLADSFFEEAATSYREALGAVPPELDEWQMMCLGNLGYCEVVLGDLQQGVTHLYQVLRVALRRRSPRLELMARRDLAYAHLELGRSRSAARHVTRARQLAEEIGEPHEVKNALYLLGQVAVLAGDRAAAREHFIELQQRFYPAQPQLPDLLLGVDVRRLINLRA
jgi:tetratricopeptide (TPR) repeat protein